MTNKIIISNKLKKFSKIIKPEGDKSISIRWALLASIAEGKSTSNNLLRSEDILSTLDCLRKLGVKIKITKEKCEIIGNGLNGYRYDGNLTLNAGNSGTLARLILGLLVHSNKKVKITGDKVFQKEIFLGLVNR